MGLRNSLDKLEPHFIKGGKLEKMGAIYEMVDTFLYTPGSVTKDATHVKDQLDLKRMMMIVVIALSPCMLMAMYNTGLQASLAIQQAGGALAGWRGALIEAFGTGYDPSSIWGNIVIGSLYFIPLYIVTMIAGGVWEVLFATVRGHEINEGFFVTGAIFPLIVPPAIPLWQVVIAIGFGVVVGKEVFGGTGKNFLNPALTARAFLFFSYPAQISGDMVWTAVDGHSRATPLGIAAAEGMSKVQVTWEQAFYGIIPGSIGETSTLACIIGAVILIATGIASWRIMAGILIGAMGLAALLNLVPSDTNPMFAMTPEWHLVLGGFAFGTVFMATDPVTAAAINLGRWIYGILIGGMVIIIRVINPAFPEGMMLAILFGNMFAPVIDFYVVKANIKRREKRNV